MLILVLAYSQILVVFVASIRYAAVIMFCFLESKMTACQQLMLCSCIQSSLWGIFLLRSLYYRLHFQGLNQATKDLAFCFFPVTCLVYSSILKMEAVRSSETSVNSYRSTCITSNPINLSVVRFEFLCAAGGRYLFWGETRTSRGVQQPKSK
jgi:hypothetical protein